MKLQDLLIQNVVSRGDIVEIARDIFDGSTGALDGYVVTLPKYDDLPENISQWIIKALVLHSTVENVFDAHADESDTPINDAVAEEMEEWNARADEEADAAREELGIEEDDA